MLMWACEPFATEDDVLAAPGGCPFEPGDDVAGFIDQASDILFQLTGGRVHGLCALTVYPTTDASCFGLDSRTSTYFDGWLGATVLHSPSMSDQFGGKIPVVLPDDSTVVTAVTIDGVALPHADYILVNGKYLVRRAGSWPVTNDLFSASGTGTWSISFTIGNHPDLITVAAASQLTIELAKAYGIGRDRGFGPGVIGANVQGVQVTIEDLVDAVRAGRLAIPAVDRFLAIYAPEGRQTAGVYSPELVTYRLEQVTRYP